MKTITRRYPGKVSILATILGFIFAAFLLALLKLVPQAAPAEPSKSSRTNEQHAVTAPSKTTEDTKKKNKPLTFTVLGCVKYPGDYKDSSGHPIDQYQAIRMAGGLSSSGDPRKITISRSVNGTNVTLHIHGKSFDKADPLSTPVEILSGDVIEVSERIVF